MLRYCTTLAFIATSFLSTAQLVVPWPYPNLDPALTGFAQIEMATPFDPSGGGTKQLNYDTGQPETVSPAVRFYDASTLSSPTLNLTGFSQPFLPIALGGTAAAPAYLITTSTETRSIKEVWVGRHLNGQSYNTLVIQNQDTLRIEKLYIPHGSTLIHEGPGPLVIQGEMHNNGYVSTGSTGEHTIVFEADYTNHIVSTCENTGTLVGRIRYQNIIDRASDAWNSEYLSAQWVLLAAGTLNETYNGNPPAFYLEDILASTAPYLPQPALDMIADYISQADTVGAAQLVIDLLSTMNIPAQENNWKYGLEGWPLKGIRPNKLSGDWRNKGVWQPLDLYLLGREGVTTGGVSYTNLPVPKRLDPLYLGTKQGEDAYSEFSSDDLLALGGDIGLYVNLENNAELTMYLDDSLDFYGSGYDISNIDNQQDSAYFVGAQVWAVYTSTLVEIESGDTVIYVNDIPVTDLQFTANISLLVENLSATTGADPDDPATYSKWYYPEEGGIDGWYGWRELHLWPTSTTMITEWDNISTRGSNANRSWEDPNHLTVRDTITQDIFTTLWGFDAQSEPMPTMAQVNDPAQSSFMQYYPDNYPYTARTSQPGEIWPYGDFAFPDYDTPTAFPYGHWRVSYATWNTERVFEFEGMPWLNSQQAYDEQPFHPAIPGQPNIPNLMPGQSQEGEVSITSPPQPNFTWVYAPNGGLFEGQAFQNCIDTASTLFADLGFESETDFCFANASQVDVGDLIGYTTNGNIFSPEYSQEYADEISLATANPWELISNPLMGYLDLNLAAASYFEDNPTATFIEFLWFNASGAEVEILPNFAGEETPDWFGDYPSYAPVARKFWRRKYFKFGDEVIASEMDYILNLLYETYNNNGAANLSDLAVDIAEDYQDGVIDATDGPVWNYLNSGDINPNKYFPLGRYVNPGQGFWMRNFSSDYKFLNITSDQGIYDHEFPLENLGEIFVGDQGPYGLILNGLELNTNSGGGRVTQTKTATGSLFNDLSSSTTVMAYAYENDTTMMPFMFFEHVFAEGASNGAHSPEEPASSFPGTPFVYTDSSRFRPTNVVREVSPHNTTPLHAFFPPPPLDGAWVIEPIKLQQTGSIYYDELGTAPFPRMAIELYDTTGYLTNIEYLGAGDTLWLRDDDYQFPIEGRIYFTNLVGDVNGDGMVSSEDLLDFFLAMGCCEADGCPNFEGADFDDSGCVTVSDYLLLLQSYGSTIGNGDGQWSAPGPLTDPMSPGLAIDEDEQDLIADFFANELPSYKDAGIKYDNSQETFSAFGQTLSLYTADLQVVAKGRNVIRIPQSALQYDGLSIVTDKGVFGVNVVDLDDINEVATANLLTAGAPYISPGGARFALDEGAELAALYFTEIGDPTNVASWVEVYTDFDNFYNAEQSDVSPTLGQIYYGAFSNTSVPRMITAANTVNDESAFIDAFGAGPANHGLESFDRGVYADPTWELATTRYKNGVYFPESVFPTKNISLAYISPQVNSKKYSARGSMTTQASVRKEYTGGIIDYFDIYSDQASTNSVSSSQWGGEQFGNFDSELHQGVLAGISQMTVREYFRFKLAGVSPKFGLEQQDDGRFYYADAFGTQYNSNPNVLSLLFPGQEWAPCEVGNYDDWYDNIIVPFFADHTGDVAEVLITAPDAVYSTTQFIDPTGDQEEYDWFYDSPLYTISESFGPLIYDMNLDGEWTNDDLLILRGVFDYWQALGDDSGRPSKTRIAAYYRAGTDALHTVANALPYYNERKDEYAPSRLYSEYFDLDSEYPHFNDAIFNWQHCLDHTTYVDNRTAGAIRYSSHFGGTTISTDAPDFLTTGGLTPILGLNSDWLDTSTAPATSTGFYLPFTGRFANGPLQVPHSSFFPMTFVEYEGSGLVR